MQYDFERVRTGEPAVLDFHPDDVCRIGDIIKVGRVRYRRTPSSPNRALVRRDVAFASSQFDEVWSGDGPDPAPRRDSQGRPVFHNRKEAEEFGRRTGCPYDEL